MSTDSSVEYKGRGSTHFALHTKETARTPQAEINQLLDELNSNKKEWVNLEIEERLKLLDQVRQDLWEVKEEWVQTEVKAKGIPEKSFGVAEEWVILAQIFRCIRQIQTTLRKLQRGDQSAISRIFNLNSNSRIALRAFPQTFWDRIIFQGVTGDIWMEPGVDSERLGDLQATRYKDPSYQGKVALVLGAGNASMLPVCDSLHKLFTELQVVVLKMNPVNAQVGPLVEKALQSIIQRGFLGVVYGDANVGDYICNHPLVEEIHMTGSDKTYEAIVFGTGSEGHQRKLDRKPINTRPFTGELGNVTPVIVVPGPWTQSDIDEYGNQITTWLIANAGFVCCAPRVIIQQGSWPQKTDLIESIKRHLEEHPTRKAYYPGAFQIHQDFMDAHPEAILLGEVPDGHLPWTFIPDLDIDQTDDICFKREPFGGIISDISLEADSPAEYLDRAVDFANQHFWGSLSVNIIVHPRSLRVPEITSAVDRAISNLKYGTVSVNMLAFYSSFFMVCPWGAFPGHDIYDIQSGKGKNFNFLMLDQTEKVVVKAPFKRIDPLTVKAKQPYVFAKKLTSFEAYPSVFKLIDVMVSALMN
jgi:acyl-CoA reductase-like NAD-dependent aldehyde dehydrogenase